MGSTESYACTLELALQACHNRVNCCLITTSLCLCLNLCCLSAYQVWLSAQFAVSASLLCSFQPVKATNCQLNRTSVKAPLHDVEHDI